MRRALALALMAISTPAAADDAQYAPYPMGGRAVGLGGAFTALADDPSGLFYNPAGLIDAARASLQVSTNLYGLEFDVGDKLFSSVAETLFSLEKVFTELQIIPTAAGGVIGFGDRGADGAYRHAYGIGAFVPSLRTVNFQTSESAGGIQDAYRRNVADRTLQASAGYAFRVDEVWRVGVSGSLTYRTLHDQEETSIKVDDPAGARFSTAETSLDVAVAAVAFTLGLKAILDEDWTLGIAVTTPTSRVYDSASVRVTRSSADPRVAASEFDLRDSSGLRADTRIGTVVRAGLARTFTDWALLTVDLAFYAPVRYQLLEIPKREAALERSLTLVNDVERRWVANLAVGYERFLGGDSTFSAGLYTNLPSSPPIEARVHVRDQLPHVTSLGGSVALGLLGEHTVTNIGLTGSFGWGKDVIARNDALTALGEEGFRTVDVRQLRLFLSLSSTFMY